MIAGESNSFDKEQRTTGNKCFIPNDYGIPSESPVFTTPTLDFQTHSMELKKLVDKLYDFKDRFFVVLNAGEKKDKTEADELLKLRDTSLRRLRDLTLRRFNQFTLPPTKVSKSSLNLKDFSTSTNAHSEHAKEECKIDYVFHKSLNRLI
jgi:hypothetical protein